MNVKAIGAIVGGAAMAGIATGAVLERHSHKTLMRESAADNARVGEATRWINDANDHFGSELSADRSRNRDVDDQIEDYKLANPPVGGAHYSRDQGWRNSIDSVDVNRNGFWGITLGAGLGGGAMVGGVTLMIATEGTRSNPGIAVGGAILAAGAGLALGGAVSNMFH